MTGACDNCGTLLVGPYCHACGQRRPEGDELTVRHALRVAADDVLHLESKTLRSMLALLKPGWLTAEYLAGHRARYTSPIKLYLACTAIFFLLAPLAGLTLSELLAQDPSGDLAALITPLLPQDAAARTLFFERFDLRFQTVYTVGLVISVLGGAAVLAVLFRHQRRPFGAHVVFELHYVSFLYIVTLVIGWMLGMLPNHPLAGAVSVLAVLGPYLYLALARVYREPARRLSWKVAVMILVAAAFDSLVSFLAVIVTIGLVG